MRSEAAPASPVPVVAVAALAVGALAPATLGTPLTLAEPATVATHAAPPLDDLALPVIDHAFAEPPLSAALVYFSAPAQDDDDSAMAFVAGAFKKTGRTLMRTSVKTGVTIRDALLRVGGAFKKVL